LSGQRGNVEVEEDSVQKWKWVFDTQEGRKAEYFSSEMEIEKKQMYKNDKHPDGEDLVRSGLILLADKKEFNKEGDADAGNKEGRHVKE
jgi:hypothetical protein